MHVSSIFTVPDGTIEMSVLMTHRQGLVRGIQVYDVCFMSLQDFVADDPESTGIEAALRCASTPGSTLALVRRPWRPSSAVEASADRCGARLLSPQTNKAWLSTIDFSRMSGGQLEVYIDYSGYIFLVGCAAARATY